MVSKKLLNDFPQIKEEGYGIAVPDLTVYFSVYSFFGFDAANGRVALPLYFYEKDTTGEYPKKVLIVSCDDWNIRDEVEIHCPDVIRKQSVSMTNSYNIPFPANRTLVEAARNRNENE